MAIPLSPIPNPSLSQLKLLADPRRLAILRLLMAAPASLTGLGQALGQHPARVRHHLKALEDAGLVLLERVEIDGGHVEKFYRAAAPALLLQESILPDFGSQPAALLMGSHDLALENALVSWMADSWPHMHVVSLPVGSLDGLTALRQGLCHLAGCHLLDVDSDEYNLPYVRRFFPGEPMLVLTLAEREQGLLTAPGNPLGLRELADLARPGVRFANRQRGSGTRLWLERRLNTLGIPADTILGYAQTWPTHTAVAQRILTNQADCAIALRAAAARAGLHFIPLFHERYDLVLSLQNASLPALQPLLQRLTSQDFRRQAEALGGYETSHSGDINKT